MSLPETPAPGPPHHQLGGCVAAILALVGIALVLPGLCSLIFIFAFLGESHFPGEFVLLWLVTFAVAAGGIMLTRFALRSERARHAARRKDAGD